MKTALQLSEPEETNSGEGADEEHNQNQHTLGEEQQNQVMKQRNTGQPKKKQTDKNTHLQLCSAKSPKLMLHSQTKHNTNRKETRPSRLTTSPPLTNSLYEWMTTQEWTSWVNDLIINEQSYILPLLNKTIFPPQTGRRRNRQTRRRHRRRKEEEESSRRRPRTKTGKNKNKQG